MRSFKDMVGDWGNQINPFKKLVQAFQKLVESNQPSSGIVTLYVVPDEAMLALPVLVVICSSKDEPQAGLGYHCLIVDSDNIDLTPRQIDYQGKHFVGERAPGEIYDSVFIKTIKKLLEDSTPNTPIYNGLARVVPKDFDVDNPVLVQNLYKDTVVAATMALRRGYAPEQFAFNLKDVESSEVLWLEENYDVERSDSFGNPIRSDVELLLTLRSRIGQNAQRHSAIGLVTGFIDTIPMVGDRYHGRFVMTQLRGGREGAHSIFEQLVMLAAATSMAEENHWHQAFIQQHYSRFSRDVRLLHPKLNIEEFGIDLEATEKAMNEVFLPGLIFSLDVENAGSATWYNDVWAGAASHDEKSYQAIYDAACQLTAGVFEREFQRGEPIVFDERNMVHTGHFYSELYKRAFDLREIDVLTLKRYLAERDPSVVKFWEDTFTRIDIPTEVRLCERQKIMAAFLGEKPVFTDVAYRVTFSNPFIQALRRSCAQFMQVRTNRVVPQSEPQYAWPTVIDPEPSTLFQDPRSQSHHHWSGPRNR